MYNLKEVKKLNKVLTDIETLQKRSELLDFMLQYYDHLTGTFDEVPAQWKNNNIRADKLPATNPRLHLKNMVEKNLDSEEVFDLENRR
jgi:hypothetical protein